MFSHLDKTRMSQSLQRVYHCVYTYMVWRRNLEMCVQMGRLYQIIHLTLPRLRTVSVSYYDYYLVFM